MRISIRTQLGSLFLLSSLVSVCVVSVALFLTLQQLVLILRAQRLALTASLKATQVANALETMDGVVQTIAARVWLQNVLTRYNAGDRSADLFGYVRQQFGYALTGTQRQALALQVSVTAAAGGPPFLNFTALGATQPPIPLPYKAVNGTDLFLGSDPQAFPPLLYPNVTLEPSANGSIVSVNKFELDSTSATLLGPLHINQSLSLFSITRAVNSADGTGVLGWMTVLISGRLILRAVKSHVGLSRTGTSLIIAPDTIDNRFPVGSKGPGLGKDSGIRLLDDPGDLENAMVHRVLPTAESLTGLRTHGGPADAADAPSYKVTSDRTLKMALGTNQTTVNNAGGVTLLHNQVGKGISVGFALVNSTLCDWVYQVEYSDSEILAASVKLRNVELICIGSTILLMLCLVVPVTSLWSRPVIRLRKATSDTIRPSSIQSSSEDGSGESLILGGLGRDAEKGYNATHSLRINTRGRPKSATSLKKFRIPQQVKQRSSCVEDELTDLTRVFNQMSEELEKQYTSLEERVKLRTHELELSKKAAEAANESKSLFIANISHELKTPLNGILGMTAVCLQEDDLTHIKESLGVIYRSGDLLHGLLNDLLTFSKNEAGKSLALDNKRFRLGDIASQILAIFGNQAKQDGVELHIIYLPPAHSPESTPGPRKEAGTNADLMKDAIVWGDPSRILQVVINLVGNSLKFTPRNGQVKLYIRQLQELNSLTPRISMTCEEDTWSKYMKAQRSNNVNDDDGDDEGESNPPTSACLVDHEFEIIDTGPGIEKAFQAQIFKPFEQGDVGLARKHAGTGLGLAICSQLADLMGGQINLESEPGHGSKFTLKLPLNLIKEGQVESNPSSTKDAASTIESALENDQVSPELPNRSSTLVPNPRAGSLADGPTSLTKTRLVGLSQPYFSLASNPPVRTPVDEGPPGVYSKRRQSLKVLVAEDNLINQQVVLRMLKLEEIVDVQIAKDGQEALEHVIESISAKDPYDLVLMDVQMPRLDGRQSTKLIRQAGFGSPVVALTAFADEKNERSAWRLAWTSSWRNLSGATSYKGY